MEHSNAVVDTADTSYRTFLAEVLPMRHKLAGGASTAPGLVRTLTAFASSRGARTLGVEILLAPNAATGSPLHDRLASALANQGDHLQPPAQFPCADTSVMDDLLDEAASRFVRVDVSLGGLVELLSHPAVVRVEPRLVVRVHARIGPPSPS